MTALRMHQFVWLEAIFYFSYCKHTYLYASVCVYMCERECLRSQFNSNHNELNHTRLSCLGSIFHAASQALLRNCDTRRTIEIQKLSRFKWFHKLNNKIEISRFNGFHV